MPIYTQKIKHTSSSTAKPNCIFCVFHTTETSALIPILLDPRGQMLYRIRSVAAEILTMKDRIVNSDVQSKLVADTILLVSSLVYYDLQEGGGGKFLYASTGMHYSKWCLVACSHSSFSLLSPPLFPGAGFTHG